MKIGIFGGSFNPPHNMHRDIALELIRNGYLDKIIYVPTGDSYKKEGLLDFKSRYEMVNLMISDYESLSSSDIGNKENHGYTYQTLDYFREANPDSEIYFICGTDNLREFSNWKRFEYILENYKLLVIRRNNDDIEALLSVYEGYEDRIIFAEVETNNLSSTQVRKMLKENDEKVKDYMDAKVYSYVINNGLYLRRSENMLNFSSNEFKNIALNTKQVSYETERTIEDAFLLFIKDFDKGNKQSLENLCKYIKKFYAKENIELSMEECYELTQGRNMASVKFDESVKRVVLACAYKCIHDGNFLGNTIIYVDGKPINTSDCLSHILYHGEASRVLAEAIGLDGKTAQKLGILHDIGRKQSHGFDHTIKGFEMLRNFKWNEEAFCCLTHSFTLVSSENGIIKAGRCANCDPLLKGFSISKDGIGIWESEEHKDDMALFLDRYEYNLYDLIMNLADLMATSKGIVSIKERFDDIMTRRKPELMDVRYTKACLINEMRYYLEKAKLADFKGAEIKATKDITLKQVSTLFTEMSSLFFDKFNVLRQERTIPLDLSNPKTYMKI